MLGVTNATTVNNGSDTVLDMVSGTLEAGTETVSSGSVANSTTMQGDLQSTLAGGSASGTVCSRADRRTSVDGGTAIGTTVFGGGLTVSSGGHIFGDYLRVGRDRRAGPLCVRHQRRAG